MEVLVLIALLAFLMWMWRSERREAKKDKAALEAVLNGSIEKWEGQPTNTKGENGSE